MYLPDQQLAAATLQEIVHKENGIIETSLKKVGVVEASKGMLDVGNVKWVNEAHHTGITHYRVHDGFIEIGSDYERKDGKIDWAPVLKVNAKPGDSWKWTPIPEMPFSSEVTQISTWNGKPAIIVRTENPSPMKGGGTIVCITTYAKGIGEVETKSTLLQPDKEPATSLLSERQIVASSISGSPDSSPAAAKTSSGISTIGSESAVRPTSSVPTTPLSSSGPNDSAPLDSPLMVTASELYAAYKGDEAAADKLYKGKLLTVSGLIWNGEKVSDKFFGLVMHTIGPAGKDEYVTCNVVNNLAAFMARLDADTLVPTVIGKCFGATYAQDSRKGRIMAVQLADCRISGVTDDKLPKKPTDKRTPYQQGFDDGFATGKVHADAYRSATADAQNNPGRAEVQGRQAMDGIELVLEGYEHTVQGLNKHTPGEKNTQEWQGRLDGFRKAIKDAGIVKH